MMDANTAAPLDRVVPIASARPNRIEAPTSEAAALAALPELYQRFAAIVGDSLTAVQEVEPPAEVADLHEEFVRSLAELVAVFDRFAGQVGNVESEADLEALFERSELDETGARFEWACFRLEGIAVANRRLRASHAANGRRLPGAPRIAWPRPKRTSSARASVTFAGGGPEVCAASS